jgi:hypothetical protein
MSDSKKVARLEEEGLKDTYILAIKIKGHQTWRIPGTNRKIEKVLKFVSDDKTKIVEFKMFKLNGITGIITEEKSK